MSEYISGKNKDESHEDLFGRKKKKTPLKLSLVATDVFNAAREVWKYYHRQPYCNVNASLYDIREHFQGRNEHGKMNNKSADETYMKLINKFRDKMRKLAAKIEPKVYEYEFLKV
jgi:hypothetical protein